MHGHVGYLREAYGGGEPYATRYLVSEAFAGPPDNAVKIPASVLRERLPKTLELVREREITHYNSPEKELRKVIKSFTDFVELCERKEKETGEAVTIIASW